MKLKIAVMLICSSILGAAYLSQNVVQHYTVTLKEEDGLYYSYVMLIDTTRKHLIIDWYTGMNVVKFRVKKPILEDADIVLGDAA